MSNKVNYQGYEREVTNVRSLLKYHGQAFVFYIEGQGFACRKRIYEEIQDLINDGKAALVGVYQKPLKSLHLIEDMQFELEERFGYLGNRPLDITNPIACN